MNTDLNNKIEVGDYVDEAELWRYTTIENGNIVITLDDDVEEVQELVLPNDFAKVSYSLSSEDYNDVKITKDYNGTANVFEDVKADFEDYDASIVELVAGKWMIELDNGTDADVTGLNLSLKDSDYTIDFTNATLVKVAGIDVTPLNIAGVSDDEVFTTPEGIIVDERDDWNENEDSSVEISVPEDEIEATLKVE